MLTVTADQLELIEANYRHERRCRLASIFALTYPGLTGGATPQQLVSYIDVVIEDSALSGAAADDEIIEFAAVGIISHGLVEHTTRVALIKRVLEDSGSNPRERLDFIWNRLLPEHSADKGKAALRRRS